MPIIDGLESLMTDVAMWISILAVPLAGLIAAREGFKYTQAEDPHEAKNAMDKLKKMILGVGIVVCSSWIAQQIISYFN